MNRFILIVFGIHLLALPLHAQALGSALMKVIRGIVHSLDNVADDAARTAARESSAILREQQVAREAVALRQRQVRTIHKILPDGTIEYTTRLLPFEVTIGRSSHRSTQEFFAQLDHCAKVAEAWPETARGTIRKGEENNLNFGWDSFEGYRSHAKALLDLDEGNADQAISEVETKFVQSLVSIKKRLPKVKHAVNCLVQTQRRDLPPPFSEEAVRAARLWESKAINSLAQKVEALASERPSRIVSSSWISTDQTYDTERINLFAEWDTESKAAYLLNRARVASILNATVAHYEGKLKEVMEVLENAGKFWQVNGGYRPPADIVQFDGVLEKAIHATPANARQRFHIFTPHYRLDRSWSEVSDSLRTSLDDVVVLNFLPTQKSDVAEWKGYSSVEKTAYVEWGQRVQNVLEHRQVATIRNLSGPNIIAEQLKQTSGRHKVLIVLGEAHDKETIKLRDSVVPVDVIKRAVPYNVQVVGLFCGSAESLQQVPGLSVSGKLQANDALIILKTLLSKVENGAPSTIGEFLGDAMIRANHRKPVLLVIGGTSVLIEELANPDDRPSSQANSVPAAAKQ